MAARTRVLATLTALVFQSAALAQSAPPTDPTPQVGTEPTAEAPATLATPTHTPDPTSPAEMTADRSPSTQPLSPQQAEALVHYERGRRHYATGRYRLAVRELERAYTLDPEGTNLQYNLGMVYERLGAVDLAARAYRRYLTGIEDPQERVRTQRILSRLRGARAELDAVTARRGRADGLFWATTGAALASVGIGLTWVAVNHPEDADAGLGITIGGLCLGVLATVLFFARDAPPRPVLPSLP